MDLKQELRGLLAAKTPLINLVTYEEDRVLQSLRELEGGERLGIVTWDGADLRLQVIQPGATPLPHEDQELTSDKLLPYLAEKLPPGHLVVLKDFHHVWNQKKAYVTRKLRNMTGKLRERSQCLIAITPFLDLPSELKDDMIVLQVPLPDQDELEKQFAALTAKLDRAKLPRPEVRAKLVSSALGLTTNQARLANTRVLARYGKFDERGIDLITWAKREVIRESGALEFWPASEGESDVGGLDLMKAWLKKREQGFSEEARAARLPFPRGVALIGIPGTGKSLSAKMLSGLWKLPLLRLDMGAVFGSLLGDSEKNIRQAMMLAETVCPCILWIDEMEKAFAGSGSGAINNGAATRVFGTFLTWMQEHTDPVFVLATANDVEGLPPELLNRFDRTFFLDLPHDEERKEIFRIHLKRAGEAFPDQRYHLAELVERSRGFVGREIERVVREAQFTAFADENREIEQRDLLQAMSETVPLSKSHADVIEQIRKWLTEGRAFPASCSPAQFVRPRREFEV